MATIHNVDGSFLVCASSKIFRATLTDERLDIIDVFDVKDMCSSVVLSTKNGPHDAKIKESLESCQVLCSAVSDCGSMLAVGTSAKVALILNTTNLQLRRAFRIPKAPTSVCFSRDKAYVVIGDRAGHVCRYTVEASEKSGYIDMNGEECDCEGEPLTSTISMVLDVAITIDGKFLLSADRDEKIRVSRYPQAFVVQSFCLGHAAYVSSLAQGGNRVFSCGGDSVVHEWDIQSGQSVAHSVKLGDEPLRKLRILSMVESVEIIAIGGCNIFRLDDKLSLMKSVKVNNEIMDITVQEKEVITLSNAGVHLVDTTTGNIRNATITDDLSEALSAARDPISNYFKNVTHQNMVDYFKRKAGLFYKAEKIEQMKENQNRKRKAKELRRKAAKKLAKEAEMAC